MRKKIGVLVLVILIGVWVILPVSGWAWIGVWRPIYIGYQQDQTENSSWQHHGTEHTPWEEELSHSTQSEQSEEGMIVGPKVIVPSGSDAGNTVPTKQYKSKRN